MSRRRYISTDMSLDRRLRDLAEGAGEVAVVLYTLMIPHVEDDGSVKGDTEEILARVLPLWRWVTVEDCERALSMMEALGLIEAREGRPEVRFPLSEFYRVQSYITANRRRTESISAEQRSSAQIASSLSSSSSSSVSLSIESTGVSGNRLLKFWNQYYYIAGEKEATFLSSWDELEDGVILSALEIGIEKNARNIQYVRGILNNWVAKGIRTVADLSRNSGAVPGGAVKSSSVGGGGLVALAKLRKATEELMAERDREQGVCDSDSDEGE